MGMLVRETVENDGDAIWGILEPIIRAGETYTLPRKMDREDALAYWFSPGHEVFVAQDDGEIVGTYFLKANQKGGGSHVANCGYMTAPHATGRGVARAMCAHSLEHARERGFRAMQFNSSSALMNAPCDCGRSLASRSSAAFAKLLSTPQSVSSMRTSCTASFEPFALLRAPVLHMLHA